jgi:BCD family chlorophyll transporter-like MFS transporter
MAVELALPALIPGALVGWHYTLQLSRPRWGYGADAGGARSPWIAGGIGVLAIGAILAALATALIPASPVAGLILAVLAFTLIGVGVGAAGTNLLALLAQTTSATRKAPAAAIVWIMMILGFVLTTLAAGAALDPFSLPRLVLVVACVGAFAFALTLLALHGLERGLRRTAAMTDRADSPPAPGFRIALAEVWSQPETRHFTVFVGLSMLAYSAQDLILEPYAGVVHGYDPGASTRLASFQNQGVLLGMVLTAILGGVFAKQRGDLMRIMSVVGCLASGLALGILALGAMTPEAVPGLKLQVFALGFANGTFAVAAIGSMMTLAAASNDRIGTRMGVWGSAQAIAVGVGGFLGAAGLDALRALGTDPASAFAAIFAIEGALFVIAAALALGIRVPGQVKTASSLPLAALAEAS